MTFALRRGNAQLGFMPERREALMSLRAACKKPMHNVCRLSSPGREPARGNSRELLWSSDFDPVSAERICALEKGAGKRASLLWRQRSGSSRFNTPAREHDASQLKILDLTLGYEFEDELAVFDELHFGADPDRRATPRFVGNMNLYDAMKVGICESAETYVRDLNEHAFEPSGRNGRRFNHGYWDVIGPELNLLRAAVFDTVDGGYLVLPEQVTPDGGSLQMSDMPSDDDGGAILSARLGSDGMTESAAHWTASQATSWEYRNDEEGRAASPAHVHTMD